MWKDSYKIGIEQIDNQHKELFNRVEKLLAVISTDDNTTHDKRGEYEALIKFLKEYVVKHFRDEEEYQAKINYPNMSEHVLKHRAFANVIADYEKKLNFSDYAIKYVKELSGTLVAWLVYHVVKEDLAIAKFAKSISKNHEDVFADFFSKGVSNVFEKIAHISTIEGTHHQKLAATPLSGDVFVEIAMTGDVAGTAVFGFSKDLAFQLIKIMTMLDVDNIDELVCSAMGEIANIISANATTMMMANGIQCNITSPIIRLSNEYSAPPVSSAEALSIDTKLGKLEMAVIKK